MWSQADVERIAGELAREAGISNEQAHKVLELLHVSKVAENLEALRRVVGDEKAVNALGFSQAGAENLTRYLDEHEIALSELRVGLKPPHMAEGLVA
jgi:hypothetical protein